MQLHSSNQMANGAIGDACRGFITNAQLAQGWLTEAFCQYTVGMQLTRHQLMQPTLLSLQPLQPLKALGCLHLGSGRLTGLRAWPGLEAKSAVLV